MLIARVGGSGSRSHVRSMFHAVELLIEYPPPRTPNLPATAGSARIAAAALPPLRFRSSPQPHLTRAGEAFAYSSAKARSLSAARPLTSAARSKVHGDAF